MRFHMGVSFRLKSLKKFIWPVLIGLLAYFLGSGVITAKADDFITQTQLLPQNISYCDVPITEYIDYFERIKSDNYEFFVTFNGSSVSFNFYPSIPSPAGVKPNNYLTATTGVVDWLKLGSTTENYNGYARYNTFTLSLSSNRCENIDLRDSVTALSDLTDWFESYHDFYTNYQSIFSNINATNFYGSSSYRNNNTGSTVYVNQKDGYYNAFIEFDYTSKGQYLLYSSRPTYYDENPTYFTFDIVPKKLKLNNVLYESGDLIDFGYEYTPVYTYDEYTQINDIYVYTPVNDLNRVNFEINYQTKDDNWANSNLYLQGVYGIVYNTTNGTNISFEKIDSSNCSFSYTISNNKIDFDGISCTIPSQYTAISLHFIITNYTGIKNPLYDLTLVNNSSSYNNIYVNETNNWVSTDWVLPFGIGSAEQPYNRNWFISSANPQDVVNVRTTNNGLWVIPYSINPFQKNTLYKEKMISDDYTSYNNGYYVKTLTPGTSNNLGYVLTSNTGVGYPSNFKIAIFGNVGTWISSNYDMNYCYYYNGSFSCNYINSDEYKGIAQGDYGYYEYGDVKDYNNIVANFINGMSTDMINFGSIVQDVWDTIPDFLESTIVVIFILSNIFIVYNLIKRR